MTFIHDDPEFVAFIAQVEAETSIDAALVEKDYWITHSMWALHETKLAIWFKGGTSLSKGFGMVLDDTKKRASVERAYAKIAPMFWGPRIPLDDACATIREWVGALRR